jgi:hypothetical protein
LPDAPVPPAEQGTRLAALAITLRRRSPWEAMDLGLTMLQRWWRAVYAPHSIVSLVVMGCAIGVGWALQRPWLALLLVWWLKPVYDRAILHVLSRAVFGELQGTRSVLAAAGTWLRTGLVPGLAVRLVWFDLARSFNLPVRQLEGQSGRGARERRAVLSRRTQSYAVWLTVVCFCIEVLVIYNSIDLLGQLFLPATAAEGKGFREVVFGGEGLHEVFTFADVLAYAATVWFFEPFYVAAGFGLYLNRRTLLEGWDIEMALRRIAERHAVAATVIAVAVATVFMPSTGYSQEKNPKQEIAEVLKAKEFGYHREVERWQPKKKEAQPDARSGEGRSGWLAVGYAIAKAAEVLLWIAAGALIAYALWWAARMLPRQSIANTQPYRPPPALFGMELAPETLPPDISATAAALAREGRLREALSLLYRGALSELVHKRGVRLLVSHTEGDVLRLSGEMPYLRDLIDAWGRCAYARRMPPSPEVQRLADHYKAAFA